MATCRPCVSVYRSEDGAVTDSVLMPSVFMSPIRPDLVRYVHTNMAKNKRQPYAVSNDSGYQSSAVSWGTGRAVSRIPRVPGGGTHRAGQAAFGNMCRGGGMFAPTRVWRRWNRKINITERRHAVATAIAASGLPSLVMARGHRIDQIPELPLVVSDNVQTLTRTKQAEVFLKTIGCEEDVEKVKDSKKIRCGVGKSRNRRYVKRKGPLLVYAEDGGLTRAFRNIPGIEMCHIDRLNLLKLAPGGSIGRLCIWTSSAFQKLKILYGKHTGSGTSQLKKGYHLQRPMMTNADVTRIINSDEIQSIVRPARLPPRRATQKKNPLKNHAVMCRISPASASIKKFAHLSQKEGTKMRQLNDRKRQKTIAEARKHRKSGKIFFKEIVTAFDDKRKEEEAKAQAAKMPETAEN